MEKKWPDLSHTTDEDLTDVTIGVSLLRDLCHNSSWNAGWYINPKTGEPYTHDWVPEKIALIHSEVSEALEGHRKDRKDEHLPHRPSVEVELADAVIRIMDLAGALKLDLAGAIIEKLQYNAQRADHKLEARQASGGKKF